MNFYRCVFRFFVAGCFVMTLVQAGGTAETSSGKKIVLPKVPLKGERSLEELMWERKSLREYSAKVPTWKQTGQLLWAAQGINRPENQHRTVPSAWGMYPLQIYVIVPDGLYHYLPGEHAVEQIKAGNVWPFFKKGELFHETVYHSSCVFLVCADFKIMEEKSQGEAARYIYLEGGHAAQNLLLQAASLGMGCVPVGAIVNEQELIDLGIPEKFKPIYVIAAGFPKEKP